VGKPRYRIPQDAIIEFENRRSAAQVKTTRRRRQQPVGVIEYF
jgi:hypothetical protein